MQYSDFTIITALKKDIFGKIELAKTDDGRKVIIRNWRCSNLFVRPIAYYLALREKRILKILDTFDTERIPQLIYFGNGLLIRSYIEGKSLKESKIQSAEYYSRARELLGRIHAKGVVHNDLEKPENWLVTEDDSPAIVDFQIAFFFPKKGPVYNVAAREDVRHLIKQKSRFFAEDLSLEEKDVLRQKSIPARIWNRTFKPIYNFITRKILRYSDRQNSKYSR
jgi:serine/threonine protein kinase